MQWGGQASEERFRPACAKPLLQKPCGGQALRRRQGGTTQKISPRVCKNKKTFIFVMYKSFPTLLMDRNSKSFRVWPARPTGFKLLTTGSKRLPSPLPFR
jgi:hypothetical protein